MSDKKENTKTTVDKPRDWGAVDAFSRTGAGPMGGDKKRRTKKERKKTKQNLKREY